VPPAITKLSRLKRKRKGRNHKKKRRRTIHLYASRGGEKKKKKEGEIRGKETGWFSLRAVKGEKMRGKIPAISFTITEGGERGWGGLEKKGK